MTRCRICGWDLGEPGWVDGDPLYIICACCGGETGVDDYSRAARSKYLTTWVAAGQHWFIPDERAAGWSLDVQFAETGIDTGEL